MGALPLASRRMRTSFLLNSSRSRTTYAFKGVYHEIYDILGAKMCALPLASRRMRKSILLNRSRTRTICVLKGQYQKDNGLDGRRLALLASRLLRTSFLLNSSRNHTKSKLKIGYCIMRIISLAILVQKMNALPPPVPSKMISSQKHTFLS
jgi:hypothetical protein